MRFLKDMILRAQHSQDASKSAATHQIADVLKEIPRTGEALGADEPSELQEHGEAGSEDSADFRNEDFTASPEIAAPEGKNFLHQQPEPVMATRKPDKPEAIPPVSTPPLGQDRSDPPNDLNQLKIWEMFEDVDDPIKPDSEVEPEPEQNSKPVPASELSDNELARNAMRMIRARAPVEDTVSRPAAPAGRAKTRLLGFNAADAIDTDLFADAKNIGTQQNGSYPTGWLVVIAGQGRGASFSLFSGVSQIGRGENQTICLDFGDMAISRENHAAIAYDDEQIAFFIGHGGKANIVRLNGRPVLSTEKLTNGDEIRIGESTLRFVAMCGPDFSWNRAETNEHNRA